MAGLYNRVGATKVNGYFDDNYNGVVTDETQAVDDVLSAAEGEMYARLMRAYPGDPSEVGGPMQLLVANDPALRRHCDYVALQFASERRPEFTDADGNGTYKTQYDLAIAYFESLSKGLKKSPGSVQAGAGATSGGTLQPKPPAATAQQFIFSPGRDAPGGHGGFILPIMLALAEVLRGGF